MSETSPNQMPPELEAQQAENAEHFSEALQTAVSNDAAAQSKGYADAYLRGKPEEHQLDSLEAREALENLKTSDENVDYFAAVHQVKQLEAEEHNPLLTSAENAQLKKDLQQARSARTEAGNKRQPQVDMIRDNLKLNALGQISDELEDRTYEFWGGNDEPAETDLRAAAPEANPSVPAPVAPEAPSQGPDGDTPSDEPEPPTPNNLPENVRTPEDDVSPADDEAELDVESLSKEELDALLAESSDKAMLNNRRSRITARSGKRFLSAYAERQDDWDEDRVNKSVEKYLRRPIGEDEERPNARNSKEVNEKLNPENLAAMSDQELQAYSKAEFDRSRFRKRDAAEAKALAEKALEELAKRNEWDDAELAYEKQILEDYIESRNQTPVSAENGIKDRFAKVWDNLRSRFSRIRGEGAEEDAQNRQESRRGRRNGLVLGVGVLAVAAVTSFSVGREVGDPDLSSEAVEYAQGYDTLADKEVNEDTTTHILANEEDFSRMVNKPENFNRMMARRRDDIEHTLKQFPEAEREAHREEVEKQIDRQLQDYFDSLEDDEV